MSIKQMGTLGVGRVAGYVHPADSVAELGPDQDDEPPDEDDEARIAAIQAVLDLEPQYVGATTSNFPIVERGPTGVNVRDTSRIVYMRAKLAYLSLISDPLYGEDRSNVMCNVEIYNTDGSINSVLSIDRLEAAQYFNLPHDPLLRDGRDRYVSGGHALHQVVTDVVGAQAVLDQGVTERNTLRLLAASCIVTSADVLQLRALGPDDVSAKIIGWLNQWRQRVDAVAGGFEAVKQRAEERVQRREGRTYATWGVALELLERHATRTAAQATPAPRDQMQTPSARGSPVAAVGSTPRAVSPGGGLVPAPITSLALGRSSRLQALPAPAAAPSAGLPAPAASSQPLRFQPTRGVHFQEQPAAAPAVAALPAGAGVFARDSPAGRAHEPPASSGSNVGGATSSTALTVAAVTRDDACGVSPLFVKATVFGRAARDQEHFDSFLVKSALLTTSASIRDSLLAPPLDASKRATLCGALEDYLASSDLGVSALEAMLPASTEGAGSASADMMDVLRTLNEATRRGSGASTGSTPQPMQQQNIHVRVDGSGGATITANLPEEDVVEAQSLGQDVSDIIASPTLLSELRALGSLAASSDATATQLASAVEEAGEPIRRMLRTTLTEQLEKLMAHNSYSGELIQTVSAVRTAMARRQWSSVHGATSSPSSDELKIMRACVAGRLSKARPGLFVASFAHDGTEGVGVGVGASSSSDPLSFLEKMPSGEASLSLAVFLTVAHLQMAFPAQAAQTVRFYVALLKWIRVQRAQGASWSSLSTWWAGLFKHIDQRFMSLMLRRTSTLPPLDPKCITDTSTEYNMLYSQTRSVELAQRAAAAQAQDAKAALDKQIADSIRDHARSHRPGKRGAEPSPSGATGGGGKKKRGGKGSGRGASGGGRGNGGGSVDPGGGGGRSSPATATQPLAITDKSAGLSGKSVQSKDKHWKEGQPWDLTALCKSLRTELGEHEGKSPCPFFHLKGKCNNSASDCRWFH